MNNRSTMSPEAYQGMGTVIYHSRGRRFTSHALTLGHAYQETASRPAAPAAHQPACLGLLF